LNIEKIKRKKIYHNVCFLFFITLYFYYDAFRAWINNDPFDWRFVYSKKKLLTTTLHNVVVYNLDNEVAYHLSTAPFAIVNTKVLVIESTFLFPFLFNSFTIHNEWIQKTWILHKSTNNEKKVWYWILMYFWWHLRLHFFRFSFSLHIQHWNFIVIWCLKREMFSLEWTENGKKRQQKYIFSLTPSFFSLFLMYAMQD
jgi:hypothetical protein